MNYLKTAFFWPRTFWRCYYPNCGNRKSADTKADQTDDVALTSSQDGDWNIRSMERPLAGGKTLEANAIPIMLKGI